MRESALAYKYRRFAILLIVVLLLFEAHQGSSEITLVGRCYQLIGQGRSTDFVESTAPTHHTSAAVRSVESPIIGEACTSELLDGSHDLALHGEYLRTVRKASEVSAAFRLFLAAVLSFALAATAFIRRCRRFYLPCPSGELFVILDYIHKLDGKK